jgi:hypothetical protein
MEEQTAWQQTEQQPANVPPQKDKKNLAIAGFVLGIAGAVLAYLWSFGGIVCGIIGIVMSAKSLKSSKRLFAIIGLVLSIACIVAAIAISIYRLSQIDFSQLSALMSSMSSK